jgi:hypothetical protein
VSADLVFPIYCHNDVEQLEKIFSGKGLQIFFVRAQAYWSNNNNNKYNNNNNKV